jgi:hypothetical protein
MPSEQTANHSPPNSIERCREQSRTSVDFFIEIEALLQRLDIGPYEAVAYLEEFKYMLLGQMTEIKK